MSIFSNMQQTLATIPGMLGTTLQIRRMTSSLAVQGARTYALSVGVVGLIQNRGYVEDMDPRTMGMVKHEIAEFSCDLIVAINPGDCIIDADTTTYWAVIGRITSGVGTATYRLQRDQGLLGMPDRAGAA